MLRIIYKTAVPEPARIKVRRLFDSAFCRGFGDKERFGGRCRWSILKRGLNANSVVYSGGVGEDISFELELIDRFGCDIQIFDPSPAGAATIARAAGYQNKLHFKAEGLARSATPMQFHAKEWEQHVFFYKEHGETNGSTEKVSVPCTTIASELKRNGHSHIDLLKIDIEGFEYEVLESCLEQGILPRQICVEFHHFFPGGSKTATAQTIWKLRQAGYRLVHKDYYDLTFYHRAFL